MCFFFIQHFGMEILQWGHDILGETVKRLCKVAGIEGQFTNHSLRATTATRALKKGIPDKFVMQRTGQRDVRSLQKYQRPQTSTKIEFSKAFDSSEAVSLSVSSGSEKAPLKREVELQEEITCKFSKGFEEAGIPETKSVTFNQCTYIISKDWKLNWKETCISSLHCLQ